MSKNTADYSKSKQKREAIKQANLRQQHKRTVTKVTAIVVAIALVGGIGGYTLYSNRSNISRMLDKIEPETDYSAGLDADGKIADVNTADYVGTFDVASVTLNESDVTYSDEDLESHIQSLLDSNKEVSTDTTMEAASGDTLNINYAGTVDGVAFDGGTAEDQDLELGSGTFIDDFEDQLVGAHPGDDVTVNVTFPEDYGVDDLNGKDAVFEVHVNGIYVASAFDDAFVQEYLADSGCTTAEEYKTQYTAEQTQSLYETAINDWIGENVHLASYPETYLNHVKGLQMTSDQNSFESIKSMYSAFGMDFDYDDYRDYYVTDTQTYEQVRDERAETTVTKAIVYQNVFENAGLEITDEEYQAYLDDNSMSDEDVETNGEAYIRQQIIREKAQHYMQDLVTVTADTSADEASTEAATEAAAE